MKTTDIRWASVPLQRHLGGQWEPHLQGGTSVCAIITFDEPRAANNETQLSFEASLKVVEEEEEEVEEVDYEDVEDYDGAEYDQEEELYNTKDFFAYDEAEWDWRSRAGDLASEKDENWDNWSLCSEFQSIW